MRMFKEAPAGEEGSQRAKLERSGYGVGPPFLLAYWGVSGIGKVRKEIGANVRTFRKRAGLSQEKLGEKADLHPGYISQVERGAKAGKRPKRGICGRMDSFPASCSSKAKARISQQSDALVLDCRSSR